MATKIRLKRIGRKNRPFYRMVLMDSRKKRDGASIEELGWYNPISDKKDCELKSERIIYWLNAGAQPSKAAKKLIKSKGIAFEWHLLKSGADQKEIQKQLKKRDLDLAAAKENKGKSSKVADKQKKNKKEDVQDSGKEAKISTDKDSKEEISDIKEEVQDSGKEVKTSANKDSKEENSDIKEEVQDSGKEVKTSANKDSKEEISDTKEEVQDIGKTDANVGSKEKE